MPGITGKPIIGAISSEDLLPSDLSGVKFRDPSGTKFYIENLDITESNLCSSSGSSVATGSQAGPPGFPVCGKYPRVPQPLGSSVGTTLQPVDLDQISITSSHAHLPLMGGENHHPMGVSPSQDLLNDML